MQTAPSQPFTPDPQVQDILKLETFQDHFDLQDFIATLSDKLITTSIQDPSPFDPLPFLRTFSNSVDSLLDIRKDVQKNTDLLEAEVKKAENDYGKRLGELDKGFEAVGTSFQTLESRITSVGRTAIRIGETLETLHLSRNRAQSSSLLLSYYLSLSRGDTSPLDKMLKEAHRDGRDGREGRMRLAVVLRRLVGLVKEETGENEKGAGGANGEKNGAAVVGGKSKAVAETRGRIEGFCERFEKEVLGLFDRWYRKGDPKMMAHCARVLLEFNGGSSCVQIYVNQHDFFISKDRVGELNSIGESELWQSLPDPMQPAPKSEPTLAALYEEIRVTVSQEAQIIQAVFPNPPVVMQVFLQRVFAQVIQQNIESLLTKAHTLSTLSSLRILHTSHTLTSSLVDSLKVYDFPGTSAASAAAQRSNAASVQDTLSMLGGSRGGGGGGEGSLVALTLEGSMEELFGPYLEGVRYLERESKSLGELYGGFLTRFSRYHETVHKAKPNTLFDRVVNQLSTTASTSSSASHTTQAAAAAILKYSGVERNGGTSSTPTSLADDAIKVEDGALSLDVGEKMLRFHAEAVGRCVELSGVGDVPKNAFALMRVLAEALGRSYIETALDSAISTLDAHDPKLEPSLAALPLVKQADLLCSLWQKYTSTALLPLANPSVTVRREMVTFERNNVGRVEGKIQLIVGKLLDGILAWLGLLLTKQKKNDFKPKNDDISFERVNTEPCLACVDVLEKVRDAAREGLSGKNAEGFLTEVGVGFHNLLLDHLKKFAVSVTGALMLTKDLALYQETIALFLLPPLNERFAMLRQLGNLFVVQPEVLKSFMQESYLSRIQTPLLRPYLMMRVDYYSFAKRFMEDEGFGVDLEAVEKAGGNGMGQGGGGGGMVGGRFDAAKSLGRTGLSRLGGLMKDLEGYSVGNAGGMIGSGASEKRSGQSQQQQEGGGGGVARAASSTAPPPSAFFGGF